MLLITDHSFPFEDFTVRCGSERNRPVPTEKIKKKRYGCKKKKKRSIFIIPAEFVCTYLLENVIDGRREP